jgi:hypothetical protein
MIHCFDAIGMQMENLDMSFSVLINCVIEQCIPPELSGALMVTMGCFQPKVNLVQSLNPELY